MDIPSIFGPKRNPHFHNGLNVGFGSCLLLVGLYVFHTDETALGLLLICVSLATMAISTFFEWRTGRKEIRASQKSNLEKLVQ